MVELDPIVKLQLSVSYPYDCDKPKVDEIKRMLEDLQLTPLQAKSFVDAVYFSYQQEHGLYPSDAEFNYYANEQYNRFKRNLGKEKIAIPDLKAVPELNSTVKWDPYENG